MKDTINAKQSKALKKYKGFEKTKSIFLSIYHVMMILQNISYSVTISEINPHFINNLNI